MRRHLRIFGDPYALVGTVLDVSWHQGTHVRCIESVAETHSGRDGDQPLESALFVDDEGLEAYVRLLPEEWETCLAVNALESLARALDD